LKRPLRAFTLLDSIVEHASFALGLDDLALELRVRDPTMIEGQGQRPTVDVGP
jgi:hypothetical protein